MGGIPLPHPLHTPPPRCLSASSTSVLFEVAGSRHGYIRCNSDEGNTNRDGILIGHLPFKPLNRMLLIIALEGNGVE